MKLDDEESSLKWCEWWLGDMQENVSLTFEVDRDFEDMMIFEAFLLKISWGGKSKVLLGHDNFFNHLGGLNLGGRSSFGWFPNS